MFWIACIPAVLTVMVLAFGLRVHLLHQPLMLQIHLLRAIGATSGSTAWLM